MFSSDPNSFHPCDLREPFQLWCLSHPAAPVSMGQAQGALLLCKLSTLSWLPGQTDSPESPKTKQWDSISSLKGHVLNISIMQTPAPVLLLTAEQDKNTPLPIRLFINVRLFPFPFFFTCLAHSTQPMDLFKHFYIRLKSSSSCEDRGHDWAPIPGFRRLQHLCIHWTLKLDTKTFAGHCLTSAIQRKPTVAMWVLHFVEILHVLNPVQQLTLAQ